jgi:diguanylate cyclase (GGDEF)-like protein
MLVYIDKFFTAQPKSHLAALLILLVFIVGAVDHLTGYEISFSIFYLIPIYIGSWYLTQHLNIFICVVCAVTWFIVDYTSGHQYSHELIPYWNACVRLGIFFVVAILLKKLKGTLEHQVSLAQIDDLTGLMNARTFKQRCSAHFQLASRHPRTLVLGYLDLDDFKSVNDNLGHNVGDEVLRAVGNTLATRLRSYDIGARLGGDEFSILLPDIDSAGAHAFFHRLHNSLLELASSNHWPLGVSVGVAIFHSPPTSLYQAMQIADALMYKVKCSGKNGILFEEFGDAPDVSNAPMRCGAPGEI